MIDGRNVVDSLCITCKRGDLGTNAALITAYPDRIEITFGNPSMLGGVNETAKEIIRYDQHPEAKAVRSFAGWNLAEVHALTGGLDDIGPEETQRPQ